MRLLDILGLSNTKEIYSTSRGFFLFIIVISNLVLITYGALFWQASLTELLYWIKGLSALFLIYSILFLTKINMILLYRLTITTIHIGFFVHAFYTNGFFSPGAAQIIIPSVLGFFYEKRKDKYMFLFGGVVSLLLLLLLTQLGYTRDSIPETYSLFHTAFSYSLVFILIAIFTILLWNGLETKNRELLRSISKLEETTQKLIDAEKMASLGTLSAGVAHEIKNPLNYISSGVELLKREKQTSEEAATFLQTIEVGMNKITGIVRSLGHFSRNSESMNEDCSIHEIIDNVLLILQPSMKTKVRVQKTYYKSPLIVKGNVGQLHQVITNIIANAEQAIEAQGEIRIVTSMKATLAQISISDTGVGISHENIKKIQEPFFTTKPPGVGTGLGLSITKKLIHDHHGGIDFSSSPGKGTTVVISLPLKG